MTNEQIKKKEIESALAKIPDNDFLETSKDLLAVLGYRSQRTAKLWETVDEFIEALPARNTNTETEGEFRREVESVELVFQVTDDEVNTSSQGTLFETPAFDRGNAKSFMFFTVQLKGQDYPRGKYAQFTREINKRIIMPVVVIFRVEDRLTLCFVGRRPHKGDPNRDVLEQVTLIKDIQLDSPHRAHLDILFELSLEECAKWMGAHNQPENFDGLLAAWGATLDTEELNKQFYRKLFNWFEWAVAEAKFPTNEKRVLKPEEHVIRLITRLLFVWFIKEKGLVADELFTEAQISPLLKDYDREHGDSYYRAVLQNLFFATLNTEIKKREFSPRTNVKHRNFSVYRYKAQLSDPDKLLELFAQTPFINGGLFDCLDSEEATRDGGYRIDCFSDEHYNKLSVPNRLFFDDAHGLIPLLKHYKFTVQENTPIEQEVALDPELLGKVFENLLAAFNPETGATARKQTGSYYTPRPIVDYMVEEALTATLAAQVQPTDGDTNSWEQRLRALFDYAMAFDNAVGVGAPNPYFDNRESDAVVRAISEFKILDPAVGSGAFPMGVLHKLTLALRRLDPDNILWEEVQKERAKQRTDKAFDDTQDDEVRRTELIEINETFKRYRDSDFGRKLYLIQNSIFGLDIQSIACQIAKLRFFISLAIEQEPDETADNFGIKPLPNLETRFIAGNTLIGLESERTLTSPKAKALETELGENRERHFHATTRSQKRACKRTDRTLRRELAKELKSIGMPPDDAEKIADWDPYDQNASADWFDSKWMFGVADGFEVVIGNPPYIQLQKEGGKLGRLYAPCNFDSFIRTGDIYCLFYEKANQLLKNGGHICFITSNKWMRAAYGKKLRDYLIGHTQPVQLLDMGPGVFDATVDTNILLLQNTTTDAHLTFTATTIESDFDTHADNIARYLSDNGVAMELPPKGEPWAILSPAELALKRKIEDTGKPLKDWDVNIYFGIKTGCNEAFIIDEAKRDELIAQDPKSTEIIKPLLRGRDIERYHVQWAGLYLLFIPWHFPLHEDSTIAGASQKAEEQFKERYPGIYNHLLQHQDILSKRNKSETGIRYEWYALQRCANTYYPEFEKEKIVWKRVGSILRFAYSEQAMLCLDSTCIATGKRVPFLTAVLNSRLSHYQLFELAPKTGTGDLIVSVQALEPLLVPPITESNQHLATQIENLADQILTAKRTNPNADVSDLESEIDQMVYLLYNLTADEIKIVEDKS